MVRKWLMTFTTETKKIERKKPFTDVTLRKGFEPLHLFLFTQALF